jgi:polysaccharide export outer membrane protein
MLIKNSYFSFAVLLWLSFSGCALAQAAASRHEHEAIPNAVAPSNHDSQGSTATPMPLTSEVTKLRLGPGDEMDIAVFGIPDLSRHVRVTTEGNIYLALLGWVPVSGLTVDEAQTRIETRLVDGGYVKDPQVLITVKEYTHQAVSVIGDVAKPGLYPVLGSHTLLDVLLMAGGLGQKAGNDVTITHRDDPDHPVVVKVGLDLQSLDNKTAEVLPGDIVSVSRAGIVYVVGEVNRPGGFVMENNTMKMAEAMALAAGPTRAAALNGTTILRKTPAGLEQISVQVKKILQAKSPDQLLQPGDIVFVPTSVGKRVAAQSIQMALGTVSALAIYRP